MTGGLEQGWFAVTEAAPGVWAIREPSHEEAVVSHLVVGTERALLIDTGMGVGNIAAVVRGLTDRPLTLINSHAHWDHVGGNRRFPHVLIHAAEAPDLARGYPDAAMAAWLAPEHLRGELPVGFDPAQAGIPGREPEGRLHGGEVFDLGRRVLEVIPAPGHSPGLVALIDRANGLLFGTDAAYAGALYAQLARSDLCVYRSTMTYLAALAPALREVHASHGETPFSPALLPAMRAALDAIAAGRAADAIEGGAARHAFDGFSVLVPAGSDGAEVSGKKGDAR